MPETCNPKDCPVSARVEALKEEFNTYRANSSSTHKELFQRLGYERPMVSAVCAAETVSPKIAETVDAAALKEAAQTGTFGSCYVEGPISLDLAMDKESARIKGYESPVCGETDILLVPSMAAGNIMVKSLLEFAGAKMVGVVTGAKCPIALNSSSASFAEKYNSLLACALAGGQ